MGHTIKTGSTINGMIITDMPLEALITLRESIDDAIRNAHEKHCADHTNAIIDAMMAARDEGYHIYDGDGYEIAPEGLEVVYDDDDDYE